MNTEELYSRWQFDRDYKIDVEGFLQSRTSEDVADFISLTEEILMLILYEHRDDSLKYRFLVNGKEPIATSDLIDFPDYLSSIAAFNEYQKFLSNLIEILVENNPRDMYFSLFITLSNKEIVITVYKRKYISLYYSIRLENGLIPHIESIEEIVYFFYEMIAVSFYSMVYITPTLDLNRIYLYLYPVTAYSDIPPEDPELMGIDIEVLNSFLEMVNTIIEDFLRFYTEKSFYQLTIEHLDLYQKVLTFKITEIGENEIEKIHRLQNG